MATAQDLMGLGETPFRAIRLSTNPSAFTCSGASQASAAQIAFSQQLVFVNASNSGSGVKLPAIGGPNGCLLGDQYILLNLLGATVQVYTASTGTIYVTGTSTSGATGVGIDPGFQAVFQCVTASTWSVIKASA